MSGDSEQSRRGGLAGFFGTLPGLITAIAMLITALVAAGIIAVNTGDGDSTADEASGSADNGTPTTSEAPTPAEAIAGEWSLVSWREAPSDVTLGMEPLAGSLQATDAGAMSWTLDIDDLYWDDSGQPQASVTCSGQISLDAQISASVTSEADYSSNMLSLRNDIAESFCGGGVGAGDNPFSASYSPESSATTLEVSNSLGTFTWQR